MENKTDQKTVAQDAKRPIVERLVNCRYLGNDNRCQHEKAAKYDHNGKRCLLTTTNNMNCLYRDEK